MVVYRRSLWVMFKGILMAPCSAVLIFFFLSLLNVRNNLLLFGIPGLIFLALLNMALFGENIRFELEQDGTLRYYRKGRLRSTFVLENCLLGYSSKSDGSDHDITLRIFDTESGGEESIDCSPIGRRRFADMYEAMKAFTKEEPEVLKASPEL